jgi:hypothetical protein
MRHGRRVVLAMGVVSLLAVPAGAANPKPAPTPEPGIYLEPARDDADGPLSKLETSTMTRVGTKDLKKGIAGSMLTGGLIGGPKMAYLFEGTRSSRRVASNAWFQFHFDPKAAAAPATPGGSRGSRAPSQADVMAMMQQQMEAQSEALDEDEEGSSGMPPGARAPQDFALVRLGTRAEERELIVGMDMKPKNTLPFRVRQLGPASYRVAPEKPLPPGEYAFYAIPTQNGGGSDAVWDFGVDAN